MCVYAKSKPDISFFHRDHFVINDTLLAGCVPMDIDGDNEHESNNEDSRTLLGCVGEDKKVGGVVAPGDCWNDFTKYSSVTLKAIVRKKCFSKSVMFGFIRQIEAPDKIVPLKINNRL